MSSRMASCTSRSVLVSTLEVASSRMSILASYIMALAMVKSCFCPLEILPPSSEITVWYPLGRRMMKGWIWALFAAATTSSMVASCFP